MSKELIQQLTRIADALEMANVLNGMDSVTPVEPEQAEPVEPKKKRAAKTAVEPTHDELKAVCLAKSREDMANKGKLKALLQSYGAAKAVDVPADKLAECIGKINAGDF